MNNKLCTLRTPCRPIRPVRHVSLSVVECLRRSASTGSQGNNVHVKNGLGKNVHPLKWPSTQMFIH